MSRKPTLVVTTLEAQDGLARAEAEASTPSERLAAVEALREVSCG